VIEIIGLFKSFMSQEVLKGIDLTIADRELLAIIGESGGGKSVLLKHMIGLIKPDRGKILVDGKNIVELSGSELDRIREQFGVVFQGGALFDSLTVYGNVAFPLQEKTRISKGEIRERVKEALDDVGLRGMEEKYPAEISGGMRKRVALARALITEPKIVLFDEPTTGLDPVMLDSILKLIVETHVKYGFTGVVISHDIPEIFDVADRVAFLYKGTIAAFGKPEEVWPLLGTIVEPFVKACWKRVL
jgi:phospholipid/cholesterol/gamma-HCH transport system ATP-binding protein